MPTRDKKPDFNGYTITEKVRTKNMKTGVELPVAENATSVIVIDQGAKIPEPSTLLLLAASLGALALIRARRGNGNARGSVESNDSRVTHSTTPFSP